MDNYFFNLSTLGPGEVVVRHEDPTLGPGWLVFREPVALVRTDVPDDVCGVVEAACAHAGRGWVAGFLTYEAAAGLGPYFAIQTPDWSVRAWFALYAAAPSFYRELAPVYDPVAIEDLTSDWDERSYRLAFDQVKEALAAGETYQANLTFRQRFRIRGSPADFFAGRCGVTPPRYAAFVNGGEWQVASFSPELMFERRGEEVVAVPMKGTAAVGATRSESASAARDLAADPKSIAENIMIVDMVRNDLGSVCETGSVQTPQLLSVERHRHLLQMVSSVRGRSAAPTPDLLRALFPAASITGAPKISTMRLLRDIEPSPRHIYCGAIGAMSPDGQRFSVAIRTALFRDGAGEFGVGSGVVWDSDPGAEFAECLAKRDLLLEPAPGWELVEAFSGFDVDKAPVVDAHLGRLARRAADLAIPLDVQELRRRLDELPRLFPESRPKVRIALRRDGATSVSVGPSMIAGAEIRAVVARRPVCSADPNLHMKTNSRAVFEEHLDENPDAEEVLLYNEAGLLTEFCRGNVLLRIGGKLLTPRPAAGCLDGIAAGDLVAQGRAAYAELHLADLAKATEIWFINSVAGKVPVFLES